MSLARAAVLEGQNETALSILSAESADPAYLHIAWVALTRLLSWMGDSARARALLQTPTAQAPELRDVMPRLEFIAGTRDVTLEEYIPPFYNLPAASQRSRQFGKQICVEYYCLARKYDAALEELRSAGEAGLPDILWLDRCPLLAPLREAKDFAARRAPIAALAQRIRRTFGLKAD
jgi:hypothetical protein